MSQFQTPLKQVRGLGSAQDGTGHWWAQRLTAIALIPLCIWFAWFCVNLAGADYVQVRGAVAAPLNSVLLIALLWALFYHAQLGLQVVIEDYIHQRTVEITLLIAIKFLAIALPLAASIAVLRIALGG